MKTICKALLIIFPFLLLMSCSKNDSSSRLSGWYGNSSQFISASDFARLNQAYESNELIYNKYNTKHYAQDMSYKNTESDPAWNTSSASYGTIRYLPKKGQLFEIYNFINSNTVRIGSAQLYHSAVGNEVVGKIYTGSVWGTLLYIGYNLNYFTYVIEDNKVIISNGTILTISDNGLLKEGTSDLFQQYDPETSF